MGALLSLTQIKLGPFGDNLFAEVDEMLEAFL